MANETHPWSVREVLQAVQVGDLLTLSQLGSWRPWGLTALHLCAACGTERAILALSATGCPLNLGLQADLDMLVEAAQQSHWPPQPAHPPASHSGSSNSSSSSSWRGLGSLLWRRGSRPPPSPPPPVPAPQASRGWGSTELMAEALASEQGGSGKAGELLLPAGCERAFRRGAAPLHVAAYLGRVEAAAALLRAGADPDPVDAEGFTPLAYSSGCAPGHQRTHYAVASVELASMLLWAGADCFARHADASGARFAAVPFSLLTGSQGNSPMCRPILDVLVELDSARQRELLMGDPSSITSGSNSGLGGGASGSNSGVDSSGASGGLGNNIAACTSGDLVKGSRRQLPPIDAAGVARAASLACHVGAWCTFFPRSGLPFQSWRLRIPIKQEVDDPSIVLQLAAAGIDGADVDPWALRCAAERGLARTTEALISLGLPPLNDEGVRSVLKPGVGCNPPRPVTLRLVLAHRQAWGVEFSRELVGRRDGPGGVWQPLARSDGPYWRCPVHQLLQLHLDYTFSWYGVHAVHAVHGREQSKPSYIASIERYKSWGCSLEQQLAWRKAAAQCMEAMADLGVVPLIYTGTSCHYDNAGPDRTLRSRVVVEVEQLDPLADPEQLDLHGCNRWLWLAFARTPWSPQTHQRYPASFRIAARALLLVAAAAQRRALTAAVEAGQQAPGSRRGAKLMECKAASKERLGKEGCGGAGMEAEESAGFSIGSLPPEVLLRIIQLAAQPISTWL